MIDQQQKKRGRPPMQRNEPDNSLPKHLQEAAVQCDAFDEGLKKLTQDRMNEAPKREEEQQTKLSSRELNKTEAILLRPKNIIGSNQKINERFRKQMDHSEELVEFIAENKESPGSMIEMWVRKWPGQAAKFWQIPVNKLVKAPRCVAEALKECKYHVLKMEQQTITSQDGMGTYHGAMVVDQTVNRLDALPHSRANSIFMSSEI